jgi:hypothetical protein
VSIHTRKANTPGEGTFPDEMGIASFLSEAGTDEERD